MIGITLLALLACTAEEPVDSETGADTSDTGPPSYPSSYEDGKYRATSFQLVEDDDLNDDDVVDNKLPAVLQVAAFATGQPLKVDELNAQLAEEIASGGILLLVDAQHIQGELTVDLLLGVEDELGGLSVDPASYDNGVPTSHMTGVFTSETDAWLQADAILLPVPFLEDEPAVPVPVEDVTSTWTLTDTGAQGLVLGALPVDAFVDTVLQELVPTGEEYDPADYLDKERDEFLEYIRELANDPGVSDIELPDGRRAVSAALTVEASPSDW